MGLPCRYNHVGTIAVKGGGCLTVDGRAVENVDDIELCMEEADCTIEGVLIRTMQTGTGVCLTCHMTPKFTRVLRILFLSHS